MRWSGQIQSRVPPLRGHRKVVLGLALMRVRDIEHAQHLFGPLIVAVRDDALWPYQGPSGSRARLVQAESAGRLAAIG